MDVRTRARLDALNLRFYERNAVAFSRSRDHPWPGWQRLLGGLPVRPRLRVLDIGCGNGRLATFLLEARAQDEGLDYLGVDACAAMVDIARSRHTSASGPAHVDRLRFECARAPAPHAATGAFDLVAAFGVLHHVAGFEARRALLHWLARRLAPAGVLALSFWRFGERARFDRKRRAWRRVDGVDPARLEAGDHLLGWRETNELRYCHASSDEEIARLLRGLPLRVHADYLDDGRSRDLNRYLLLGPADARAPSR